MSTSFIFHDKKQFDLTFGWSKFFSEWLYEIVKVNDKTVKAKDKFPPFLSFTVTIVCYGNGTIMFLLVQDKTS